jgi:hypothetical protein
MLTKGDAVGCISIVSWRVSEASLFITWIVVVSNELGEIPISNPIEESAKQDFGSKFKSMKDIK